MFPSGHESGENGLKLEKRIRGFVMLMNMLFSCAPQTSSCVCVGSLCLGLLGEVFSSFILRVRPLEKHLTVPFLSLSSPPLFHPCSALPSLLFFSSLLCVLLPGKVNHSMTFCLDLILAQTCWVWGPQLLLASHFLFFNGAKWNQAFPPSLPPLPLDTAAEPHTSSKPDRLII